MNMVKTLLLSKQVDCQCRARALNEALSKLVERVNTLERELEELVQLWDHVPERVQEAFRFQEWDADEKELDLYRPIWDAMDPCMEALKKARRERDEVLSSFTVAVDFLEFCRKAGL